MTSFVVTIVLTLCNDAGTCKNVSYDWNGSFMECTLFGQQLAAYELQSRPKWGLSKYRCTTEPMLLPENTI